MSDPVLNWLAGFPLEATLRAHVHAVVSRLPGEVLAGFMTDESFYLCDVDWKLNHATEFPVRLGVKSSARSVVFKRRMWRSETPFVRWVIAHELAHAHLRNAGRFPGEDPEHAADALAADWGFPKPGADR